MCVSDDRVHELESPLTQLVSFGWIPSPKNRVCWRFHFYPNNYEYQARWLKTFKLFLWHLHPFKENGKYVSENGILLPTCGSFGILLNSRKTGFPLSLFIFLSFFFLFYFFCLFSGLTYIFHSLPSNFTSHTRHYQPFLWPYVWLFPADCQLRLFTSISGIYELPKRFLIIKFS